MTTLDEFALHRLKAMMAWIGVRAGLDGNVVLVGAQAQLCGRHDSWMRWPCGRFR